LDSGCHDRENCWNFVIELLPINKADSVVEHHDPEAGSQLTETSREQTVPRVIGLIGAVRAPEVGYMLNRDYWGRGYATEAMRAFMPLFWTHNTYEYAEAHTDPDLVSSQNILQKVGFELHERREHDFENPFLGWRDTLVFKLDRPDKAA
jgi:RimJ/RimL family protein N-acetyltransferase